MEHTNYKHIVLFKIHDEVSAEVLQKALDLLLALGQDNSDILQWSVTMSLDTRKGRIIVEDAVFANQESFENFRASPKHSEASALMREIADWLVGDYLL